MRLADQHGLFGKSDFHWTEVNSSKLNCRGYNHIENIVFCLILVYFCSVNMVVLIVPHVYLTSLAVLLACIMSRPGLHLHRLHGSMFCVSVQE